MTEGRDETNRASHEGPPPGANALGEAGSLDSGPGVRMHLRIDTAGVVRGAGHELVHFDAARPCAEAVCAAVLDAPATDVDRTTARAVARLVGLPAGSRVARTVHAALRGALRPWVSPTARRGGRIVCACFGLEQEEIVETIRLHGCRTVDDVREQMPATRGCGTCRPDIEALLRAEDAPDAR